MSTDADFEVVVGPDGGIAPGELARHGGGPGAHLRVLAEVEPRESGSAYGLLQGQLGEVSWEDFEAASRVATGEVEAGSTSRDL